MIKDDVSKSEFHMWRTLISVAHADDIVTDEEIEFIARMMEDVNFTDEQTQILKDDIVHAKNVNDMFAGITDQHDRVQFFDFARDLVWIDGDFASEEQSVMIALYQQHISDTNVDDMVGKMKLEFEDDFGSPPANESRSSAKTTGFRRFISSLRRFFVGE